MSAAVLRQLLNNTLVVLGAENQRLGEEQPQLTAARPWQKQTILVRERKTMCLEADPGFSRLFLCHLPTFGTLCSQREYRRAKPESDWCPTCILSLTAHVKPTVCASARPCRPLMWGRNWNTDERGITQRGKSCQRSALLDKHQIQNERRRCTNCCCRPLSAKVNQRMMVEEENGLLKL